MLSNLENKSISVSFASAKLETSEKDRLFFYFIPPSDNFQKNQPCETAGWQRKHTMPSSPVRGNYAFLTFCYFLVKQKVKKKITKQRTLFIAPIVAESPQQHNERKKNCKSSA